MSIGDTKFDSLEKLFYRAGSPHLHGSATETPLFAKTQWLSKIRPKTPKSSIQRTVCLGKVPQGEDP